MRTLSQSDLQRMKEKVEVLFGERGAPGQAAVRVGDMNPVEERIKSASESLVTARRMKDKTIIAAKIGDLAIEARHIGDVAIEARHIGDIAIESRHIGDLEVTTAKLDDLAVTTGKMDDLAVTAEKIGDIAIKTRHLDDLIVKAQHIDDLAVTAAKIGDLEIDATKIANLTIDASKIVNLTINGSKIASAAVSTDKVGVREITDSSFVFTSGGIAINDPPGDPVTIQTRAINIGFTSDIVIVGSFNVDVSTTVIPAAAGDALSALVEIYRDATLITSTTVLIPIVNAYPVNGRVRHAGIIPFNGVDRTAPVGLTIYTVVVSMTSAYGSGYDAEIEANSRFMQIGYMKR